MNKLAKLTALTMTAGMLLAACGDADDTNDDPAMEEGIEDDGMMDDDMGDDGMMDDDMEDDGMMDDDMEDDGMGDDLEDETDD